MVRTAVAAAGAAHRARISRQSESSRPAATSGISNSRGSYNGAQDYGTITNANHINAPASYGESQQSDHATASSTPTTATAASSYSSNQTRPSLATDLPSSDSYHGQLHRADSPAPSSKSSSSASSVSSQCLADEEAMMTLPTYSDFKLIHYMLDMPLTLSILGLFLILAVFGWPVEDSPYPHHIHWKQLGLGAITWISTEAIRRRLFRFLGSSRYALLRSTPFLLLLHTTIQELTRLFAIRLTFHDHSGDVYRPGIPTSFLAFGSGVISNPPRPPKGFFKAFHLALGFAAAENIWQTLIMLGQVRLYEDVLAPPVTKAWLVGEENILAANAQLRSPEALNAPLPGISNTEQPTSILNNADFVTDAPPVSDDEFEGYLRERKRLEFEDSFGGVPLWDISVFVIGMWRLDATLLNLSLTLLLSLPFHRNAADAPPRRHPSLPVRLRLWPTFAAVVLLHWLLSLGWTLGIRDRRRFSLAGISYVTLVGVLGIFFASLGVWSALI